MNLISRSKAGNICAEFNGKRIVVIGDLMLDHWVWGKVARISPEAPVPVVDVKNYSYTPGGAANVAANLKSLGANVEMVGVVGADDTGRRLKTLLKRQGIGTTGIVSQENYVTAMKSRIIANSQQVVRADLELRCQVQEEAWHKIVTWLKKHLNQCDCLVISDYNKGLLWNNHIQELIKLAGKVPTIGGPKPENIEEFRGATLITLNAKEAAQASGMDTASADELPLAGQYLLDRLQNQAVIITLSEKGMALFTQDSPMDKVPALASQVFDVSGAGDTVLSTMALCLACRASLSDAMRLANHAAAVVVRKVGTATLTCEELLDSLSKNSLMEALDPQRKILTRLQAAQRIDRLRQRNAPPTVVFTNGCFDVLHVGHLRTLMTAKQQGDLLVVGLNSDHSVRTLKGPKRPINSEQERAELLAGLECVDMVVIFDETTPLKLIEELRPDVHVKGGDYKEEDLPESALVKSFGGKVVLARLLPGRSTTAIVQRQKEAEQ